MTKPQEEPKEESQEEQEEVPTWTTPSTRAESESGFVGIDPDYANYANEVDAPGNSTKGDGEADDSEPAKDPELVKEPEPAKEPEVAKTQPGPAKPVASAPRQPSTRK